MHINKHIAAAAIGLSMLTPLITQAAGLTTAQVSAIVSLLQSFNADAATVANVQATLLGQKPAGQHDGEQGDMGQKPADRHDNDHGAMGSSTWSGASTTPWGTPPGQTGKMVCIALTRNLTIGSSGDDVRKIQDMLAGDSDNDFHASSTGVFGPMTAKAMMHFQWKNGIASSTNGAVGPATRGFFERSCGHGLGDHHDTMMGSTSASH